MSRHYPLLTLDDTRMEALPYLHGVSGQNFRYVCICVSDAKIKKRKRKYKLNYFRPELTDIAQSTVAITD